MLISAPLYTSSILFWGAVFGFALSDILVSLPIKKKKKKKTRVHNSKCRGFLSAFGMQTEIFMYYWV